jgi:hypothetical protein
MGYRERPLWEDRSTCQSSNSLDAQHRSSRKSTTHPEGAHICLPGFALANPMLTIVAMALWLAQQS